MNNRNKNFTDDVNFEKISVCKICNSQNIIKICDVKDTLHFIEGTFELFKCTACGVQFISNRPSMQHIGMYYPANYYTHAPCDNDLSMKVRLQRYVYDYYYNVKSNILNLISYIVLKDLFNMFPPAGNNLLMLDFGCGNGNLIKLFSRYGFVVDGYDVDIVSLENAKKYARRVFTGDIFSVKFFDKYDVIILNQVLEHIHNPKDILILLKSILKDDGILIISVPNGDCVDFSILKDCWYACQSPTHLFHYNHTSLSHLCKSVGFQLLKCSYSSPLKSLSKRIVRKNLDNIQYKMGKSLSLMKLAYLFSLPIALIPFFARKKIDRITVYLQLKKT